jgi:hypothetical protein
VLEATVAKVSGEHAHALAEKEKAHFVMIGSLRSELAAAQSEHAGVVSKLRGSEQWLGGELQAAQERHAEAAAQQSKDHATALEIVLQKQAAAAARAVALEAEVGALRPSAGRVTALEAELAASKHQASALPAVAAARDASAARVAALEAELDALQQESAALAEAAAARKVALDDQRRDAVELAEARMRGAFEEDLFSRLAAQKAAHDAELDRFTLKLEKKMTKVAREFAAKDAEIVRLRSCGDRLRALSPVPTNVKS